MKKLIFLLTAVICLFSLSACGGGAEEASATATASAKPTATASAKPTATPTPKPSVTATPESTEEPEESGLKTDGYYNKVVRGDAGDFQGAMSVYIDSDGTAALYVTGMDPVTDATYMVDGTALHINSASLGTTNVMEIGDGGETLTTDAGVSLTFGNDENAWESTAEEFEFTDKLINGTFYLDGTDGGEAFYFMSDGDADWEYPNGDEDVSSLDGTYTIDYPNTINVTINDTGEEIELTIQDNGDALYDSNRGAQFIWEDYEGGDSPGGGSGDASGGEAYTFEGSYYWGDGGDWAEIVFNSDGTGETFSSEDSEPKTGYFVVDGNSLAAIWGDETYEYTIEDGGASFYLSSDPNMRFIAGSAKDMENTAGVETYAIDSQYYAEAEGESMELNFDSDGTVYSYVGDDNTAINGTYEIDGMNLTITWETGDETGFTMEDEGKTLVVNETLARFESTSGGADTTDTADASAEIYTGFYYYLDGDSESYALYFYMSGDTVDLEHPGEDTVDGTFAVEGNTVLIEWTDGESASFAIEDGGATLVSEDGERFIVEN